MRHVRSNSGAWSGGALLQPLPLMGRALAGADATRRQSKLLAPLAIARWAEPSQGSTARPLSSETSRPVPPSHLTPPHHATSGAVPPSPAAVSGIAVSGAGDTRTYKITSEKEIVLCDVPTSEKSPAAAYGSSPAHARTSSAESPETSSRVPTWQIYTARAIS